MHNFFFLLVGHGLCDYPLQGDFLARGKNHKNPLPGVPWYQCLFWHAMIHAGAVAFVTQNIWLGLAEFVAHVGIDYMKSSERINFNEDQGAHVICKFVWAVVAWGMSA